MLAADKWLASEFMHAAGASLPVPCLANRDWPSERAPVCARGRERFRYIEVRSLEGGAFPMKGLHEMVHFRIWPTAAAIAILATTAIASASPVSPVRQPVTVVRHPVAVAPRPVSDDALLARINRIDHESCALVMRERADLDPAILAGIIEQRQAECMRGRFNPAPFNPGFRRDADDRRLSLARTDDHRISRPFDADDRRIGAVRRDDRQLARLRADDRRDDRQISRLRSDVRTNRRIAANHRFAVDRSGQRVRRSRP